MLDNPKHELFAQYLAEGVPDGEAYARAGYKPHPPNASRLRNNDKLVARVRELQERRAKQGDITIEAMTQRFNTAIEKASSDGAHPAVMAGLFNVAKLHGLIVDKAKVEQGRLDGMSDDALADDIERRLEELAARGTDGAGEAGQRVGPPSEAEPDRELSPVLEASGVPQARD